MQVKCEYCGTWIEDTDEKCPNCGAANANFKRMVSGTPKTIAELEQWYRDHNLPPYETTRFFIGINYTKPRAFGIYEENGNFIVYKNKNDGSRAIRYEGTDEAYAVNELYLKLKSEILNQKELSQAHGSSKSVRAEMTPNEKKNAKRNVLTSILVIAYVFFLFLLLIVSFDKSVLFSILAIFLPFVIALVLKCFKKNGKLNKFKKLIEKHLGVIIAVYLPVVFLLISIIGGIYKTPKYYEYNNNIYCYYAGNYYEYYGNDYISIDSDYLDSDFTDNRSDYRVDKDSAEWDSDYSFTDSQYYEDNFDSEDSSSDSDYSWSSSDSWDSGGTDFDSDW